MIGVAAAFTLTGCGNGVALGEYKGVEAYKVKCEITDEELASAVEDSMYDYTTYTDVTRPAKEGDNVNITYVTVVDGKTNDDYSGEEEDIVIGDGYVFPEIDAAVVGMKNGDKKSLTVKLNDDFADDEDVGKEAKVELTLNNVSEENTPECTDAFVKENLGFDSRAEYEEDLKKTLLENKEQQYKDEEVGKIVQKVIDTSKFKGYSKELYKKCEEDYDANNEYMASMYQMELEDYESMMGLDKDTKKQDIEAMIHENQVIEAIAKKEKLTVTDDDIKKFADESYEEYECESADAFIEEYGKDEIKEFLLYQKVTDFLYDNAKLIEISEEEYLAMEQESEEAEGVESSEEEDTESSEDETAESSENETAESSENETTENSEEENSDQ